MSNHAAGHPDAIKYACCNLRDTFWQSNRSLELPSDLTLFANHVKSGFFQEKSVFDCHQLEIKQVQKEEDTLQVITC